MNPITYGNSKPTNQGTPCFLEEMQKNNGSPAPPGVTIKKGAISFDIDFNSLGAPEEEKKNQHVNTLPTELEETKEERFECPNCGRKFIREALEKHAPICQKVFQGKRDVEVNKGDTPKKLAVNGNAKPGTSNGNKKMKKAKWENQSSELRAIIHNKRMEKEASKDLPVESSMVIKTEENYVSRPGLSQRATASREEVYIHCDLCNKNFTKISYDNHINDCRQKQKDKKLQIKPGFMPRQPLITSGIFTPQNRQPMMPPVMYGGRPNFNMKFGKPF